MENHVSTPAEQSRVSIDVFHRNVMPEPNTGCWFWLGGVAQGYGRIFLRNESGKKSTRQAHRVSYETALGPIPAGLVLDHLCRNPMCVNPAHLEPVTHLENVRRGLGGSSSRSRTHCPHGHPYDDENTKRRECSPNHRFCRTCANNYSRLYYRRKRAEGMSTTQWKGQANG